jgi:enoyl-CoA hydratase/carnithine racemase
MLVGIDVSQKVTEKQMKEYGMVHKVVPNDKLEEEVEAWPRACVCAPRMAWPSANIPCG